MYWYFSLLSSLSQWNGTSHNTREGTPQKVEINMRFAARMTKSTGIGDGK